MCPNGSCESIPSSSSSDCSSSSFDALDELFTFPLSANSQHGYTHVDDLDLSTLFSDNDIANFVMESLL